MKLFGKNDNTKNNKASSMANSENGANANANAMAGSGRGFGSGKGNGKGSKSASEKLAALKASFNAHSLRERILLVILLLIVVYYFGVQLPVSKIQTKRQAELTTVQSELDIANAKLYELVNMKKEIKKYESGEVKVKTPNYDNTNEIILEMNAIFGGADNYTISFGEEEVEGKIVRRPIMLQFSADDYSEAVSRINALETSQNGYLLNETAVSSAVTRTNASAASVTINMTSFEIKE